MPWLRRVTIWLCLFIVIASLSLTAWFRMPHAASHNLPQIMAEPPVTVAPVVAAPPSGSEDELTPLLQAWIKQHPDQQWSVVYRDLEGNQQSVSVNGDQTYYAASLYKLLLMYPLLQKTPVSQFSKVQVFADNTPRSLQDCVTAMLRVSDNACGEAVADYVGWAKADSVLHAAGYKGINLNRNLQVTPQAAVDYLADLYTGKLVNTQSERFTMSILQTQKYRSGIPAGCSGCQVADKTGDNEGYLHDVGIVADGTHTYALGIFSKGGSYQQVAELASIVHRQVSS